MEAPPADSSNTAESGHMGPSAAVLFGIGSLVLTLLTIPPAFWHARNRNLGATVLVSWIVFFNFQNFLNAIIWPHGDLNRGYLGSGLCDIEVKLQVAAQVALPSALLCVLRALARVMDTDNVTLVRSQRQRHRDTAIEISWCTIPALLQMIFHYVNQPYRYYLYPVSGCVIAMNTSIMSLLIVVPPLVLTVIDSYYTGLILFRLYKYRVTFQAILADSQTTRSRFLRLYILCVVFVIGFLPTQIYTFYFNFQSLDDYSYNWKIVHETISMIVVISGQSTIFWDRWIWLVTGVMVFLFFGLGQEALTMYRTGLVALGLGRIFPRVRPGFRSQNNSNMPSSYTSMFTSINTKARLLFTRKGSVASSHLDSFSSDGDDDKVGFAEAMQREAANTGHDVEQGLPIRPPQPSKMSKVTAIFKKSKNLKHDGGDLHMFRVTPPQGPTEHGVMIQREIRQGSETAVPIPYPNFPARFDTNTGR